MRSPDPSTFDGLALEVLRYQAEANPVCTALLRARGLDSDRLERWQDFPPVPARAFREFRVYCGAEGSEEARFLTSGTTGDGRGVHPVRDLSLYHTSLFLQGERHLAHPLPRRVLALLPAPEERPDSSLVHMVGIFHERWDDGAGGFFADANWGLQTDAILRALHSARHDGVPTLLVGTAFAWVNWLDAGGVPIDLPEGSTLVETGGFKGRSRQVPRAELYDALSRRLGLKGGRIVNEYGMTEMLSQFYEPVLTDGAEPLEARHHQAPPWVRTRVLDPVTLEPVEDGESGLLSHLDLANLFSASLLLTQDHGVSVGGEGTRFRMLGRAPGAEPRGCSLVMEELMGEARG